LPLEEVKLRDAVKVIGKAGRVRQKIDHAIGVGVGERLEQNRIHYREDGGVGSDAEGKRGYGGNGEAGILPQLAQGKAYILPKQLQSGAGAMIPHGLLDLLHASGLHQRGAASLGGGHARSDSFIGNQIDVGAHFIVELLFNLLLEEKIVQDTPDSRPGLHCLHLT
jgi:hypothetical protein